MRAIFPILRFHTLFYPIESPPPPPPPSQKGEMEHKLRVCYQYNYTFADVINLALYSDVTFLRPKGKSFSFISFSTLYFTTPIQSYASLFPNKKSVSLFSRMSVVFKNTLGMLPIIVNIPYRDELYFAFKKTNIYKISVFDL